MVPVGAEGDPLRWHNGQTAGSHSFVAFDPEAQIGVVVLANTGSMVVDTLGAALVLMLRGQPYELQLPTVVAVDPATLATYEGIYRLTDTLDLTVTRQGRMLFAQATGQARFRVWPDSPTRFRYRVVDATIDFEVDEGGVVAGLLFRQDGQELRAARR